MKHRIKIHLLTPTEQEEFDRREKELVGHRPEDYANYDEYFYNEVILPTEKFYKGRT